MSLRCFAFRWLISQAQIWKRFFSSKLNKFTLFNHSFVSWNLENLYKQALSIFFCLSWRFKWKKSVFWKASFCKTRTDLIRIQEFVYKTLQLGRISLLISAIMKNFVFFLRKVILFLHLRSCENSRRLQQCMQTLDFVSG